MTNRTYVKSTLLGALIALSLGGFLLHVRIHPFAQNSSNIVPVISCLLSIIVVPLLFSFRKTISYGYQNDAEDHGRKPVGESVPAEGW